MFKVLIMLMASQLAFAGGESGGGGNAVICKERGKTKYYLLDFYEGERTEGLRIPRTNSVSAASQLSAVNQKIKQATYDDQQKMWMDTIGFGSTAYNLDWAVADLKSRNQIKEVKGIRLKPLDDSKEFFIPASNCKVERLAYYENNTLYILSDIFDKLSNTDKAGLLAHEVIYAYLRKDAGETDSRRVRKIVARLFSDQPITSIYEGIPDRAYLCSLYSNRDDDFSIRDPRDTTFFLFKTGTKQNEWGVTTTYQMQFLRILGVPAISKKIITFNLSAEKLRTFQVPVEGSDGITIQTTAASDFSEGDTVLLRFSRLPGAANPLEVFIRSIAIRSGDLPVRTLLPTAPQCSLVIKGNPQRLPPGIVE